MLARTSANTQLMGTGQYTAFEGPSLVAGTSANTLLRGTGQNTHTAHRYRAPVAQLVEHGAVTREVVSSTPAGPTLRVFK